MAREIIQVIRCDRCGNKIESEDEVIHMKISIGNTPYELEVDSVCDNFGLWTLEDVIEKGHIVSSSKRSHHSHSPSKPKPSNDPDLTCKKCGRSDFTSQQGLSMHKTRAEHWLPNEHRPNAADRKKSYRARQKINA